MPKPDEFFIGVLDFFAILLPGGIAVAILEPVVRQHVIGELIAAPGSAAAGWALFLVLAFFVGHIVFQAGSYVDGLYDRLRRRLNPYANESAYQCATRIKESIVDKEEHEALNTFQWSRAVLILKHASGAADVHRLEADSKFFRSLLVVSMIAALVYLGRSATGSALVALAISGLCFARYYNRRLKSTTQAYIHIVTMHRLGGLDATGEFAAPSTADP